MRQEIPKLELIPGIESNINNLTNTEEKRINYQNEISNIKISEINKKQEKNIIDYKENLNNEDNKNKKIKRNITSPFLTTGLISQINNNQNFNTIIPKDIELYSDNNINELNDTIYKNNPTKQYLINRLKELKNKEKEIYINFKYDSENYKKQINLLEKQLKTNYDENKYNNLLKMNLKNKELIKTLENEIINEKEIKMQEKKKLSIYINDLINLKKLLNKELKELQIISNKTSFINYKQFYEPTELIKLNFRNNIMNIGNDIETSSKEDEDSLSSLRKLNNINQIPEQKISNSNTITINSNLKTFGNFNIISDINTITKRSNKTTYTSMLNNNNDFTKDLILIRENMNRDTSH